MSKPAALVLLAVLLAGSPTGAAEPGVGGTPLLAADALARAAEGNPELAAALLEARQAAAAVTVEEGAWPYVLTLDAGISRGATPLLLAGDTVGVDTLDSVTAGAELTRQLSVGTRLSLRLETEQQLRDTDLVATGTGQLAVGPTYGVLARLSLVQPLLRGAGTDVGEAELRAARISLEGAEGARRATASALARDVLTSFYELWYAQSALEIERTARELAERQRAEAAARAEAGALAPVEVLPFATRVASLSETVLQAEQDRRNAALALGRLLGEPNAEALTLVAASAPGDAPVVEMDAAVETALARSPELAELEAQVELARDRVKFAAEALRPRLDLQAAVEARGLADRDLPPAFEQVGEANAVGGLVGLVYELPFAKGAREAEVSRARLAVQAAEARLRAAKDRIEADARALATQLEQSDERVKLARATAEIAREQLAAAEARFEAGAGTPIDVREAEAALREAELRVAAARLAQARALLSLRHLTGELLPAIATAG